MNPDLKPEGNPTADVLTNVADAVADTMPLELADSAGMAERAKKPIVSEEALALWGNVVQNLIRKSKGLKPEDTVELPDGETGHYIKYALDSAGRLSLGKSHGRRRPRLGSYRDAQNKLTGMLFGNYLGSLFRARQAEAASLPEVDGRKPELKPLTAEEITKAQSYAASTAEHLMSAPAKAKAKAARERQDASRRINRGTIAGNSNRCAHASA